MGDPDGSMMDEIPASDDCAKAEDKEKQDKAVARSAEKVISCRE